MDEEARGKILRFPEAVRDTPSEDITARKEIARIRASSDRAHRIMQVVGAVLINCGAGVMVAADGKVERAILAGLIVLGFAVRDVATSYRWQAVVDFLRPHVVPSLRFKHPIEIEREK